MPVTRDTLLKICAVINDEATDPQTRAVAQMRLEEAYRRNPELFKTVAPPRPSAKPSFADVDDVDDAPGPEASDPEYQSFFDLSDWGRSSRNPDNLVHSLADDTLITVFAHKRQPGFWGWSLLWRGKGDAVFSSRAFPTEIAAMRDCWTNGVTPRRGRRP
jgi:hypothetical protein